MIRVAIVDDDSSHRRAFARLLRASGMEAGCFDSAEAYLGTGAGSGFDCLVLDVQLGGISGLELQRRISTSERAPAVVFLSALPEPGPPEKAAPSGCAFLKKTDPAALVLETIRRAVEARSPFPKGQ